MLDVCQTSFGPAAVTAENKDKAKINFFIIFLNKRNRPAITVGGYRRMIASQGIYVLFVMALYKH